MLLLPHDLSIMTIALKKLIEINVLVIFPKKFQRIAGNFMFKLSAKVFELNELSAFDLMRQAVPHI